ncbi:MAG: RcnB family protein [Rhizobiaceae bacterium]
MKKTLLSALAAAMLAATSLGAAAAPLQAPTVPQGQTQLVDWKPNKTVVKRKVVRKNGVVSKHVVKKRWTRGHRVDGWKRYRTVDYRRYHLHRPARGYHWIRVDNDFLLVSIAGGLIASVIAAH